VGVLEALVVQVSGARAVHVLAGLEVLVLTFGWNLPVAALLVVIASTAITKLLGVLVLTAVLTMIAVLALCVQLVALALMLVGEVM
jgi:hypothetical protein